MMNIQFQRATVLDVPLLQHLAHSIWRQHYPGIISELQIEYMLELMYSAQKISIEFENQITWVLIFDHSQPIGYISYQYLEDIHEVKLHKLYVLLAYHGQGVGGKSLAYVVAQAHKLEARKLFLTVNRNNVKAVKAYKNAGFSIESEVITEIGNGFVMDDYVMGFLL